jgi:4-hydroxybenzoate polyprenyltransferase
LIAYLRLLRVGMLFSPAADVVAGLAVAALPWDLAAVRAALASTCVYAGGMVLNDHADRAEDALARPERPIPSGQVAPRTALALGLGLLLAAVALGPAPAFYAGLGLLVLAYDYAGKRVVWLGALVMAGLRGLNLSSPWLVLGAGPLPDPLLYAALAYAVYICAVTLLGWMEDQPRAKPKAVLALAVLPPLAAELALLQTAQPAYAALPGGVLALAFWFRVARRRTWDQVAIRAAMTWLLLGTMLYTGLLCAGSGRPVDAVALVAAALVGRRISRRIAVT